MYLFLSDYHLPGTKAFIYIGYQYENMVYTFDFYLNVNVDSYGLRIRLKVFSRHDNPQDYIYDYSGESSEECS